MQLTRFTDLSLRVLVYLAWAPEDRISNIGEMARAYRVPENHLVKVVHHLGKQGFVKTVRGRGGGVKLAVKPSEIRIGEVVMKTEPTLELVHCTTPDPCPLQQSCQLRGAITGALQSFIDHLNQYTLEDLTRDGHGRQHLFRELALTR